MLLLAGAACGGSDGDGGGDGDGTIAFEATVGGGPGLGVVTLGGEGQAFTVISCTDGPGPDDIPAATQQFRLSGEGTAEGIDFAVEVTRYRSDTGVGTITITETAAVTSGEGDDVLGIEAKRTSIDGRWLDLNDPTQSSPLIERQGDTVEVTATFGPEGSVRGDEALVAGSLSATCP